MDVSFQHIVAGYCGTKSDHIGAIAYAVAPLAGRRMQRKYFYEDAT
jgi:5-methyltetrahydrofolate--homocysteine methyltransferase